MSRIKLNKQKLFFLIVMLVDYFGVILFKKIEWIMDYSQKVGGNIFQKIEWVCMAIGVDMTSRKRRVMVSQEGRMIWHMGLIVVIIVLAYVMYRLIEAREGEKIGIAGVLLVSAPYLHMFLYGSYTLALSVVLYIATAYYLKKHRINADLCAVICGILVLAISFGGAQFFSLLGIPFLLKWNQGYGEKRIWDWFIIAGYLLVFLTTPYSVLSQIGSIILVMGSMINYILKLKKCSSET